VLNSDSHLKYMTKSLAESHKTCTVNSEINVAQTVICLKGEKIWHQMATEMLHNYSLPLDVTKLVNRLQ